MRLHISSAGSRQKDLCCYTTLSSHNLHAYQHPSHSSSRHQTFKHPGELVLKQLTHSSHYFPLQVESGSWKVFLGDFGLSQTMSGTNIIGTKTTLAGSPGFQSPEQLRNESTGLPSDVYALGAVLLVLFGESPVWPALAPFQIMYKVVVCYEKPHTSHLPPPPPPPPVQELCDTCFN